MQDSKDSEERRNEFVDAAERLFKKNGIVDTTISSIVKEMDVAKGLFYYYFKSKDDVIDAISEKYNEVFNEMMKTSMDKPTYAEKLEQYVDNCIDSFRTLSNQLQGKDEDVDLTALTTRSVEEAKNAAVDGLTSLFEEGMELHHIIFACPKNYADIFISGIWTLIEEREASDEEIKKIIMDLIMRSREEEEYVRK